MAALAGATERLKFGMNAVVASLRDPLVLAKQCATIDWLSNGRLLPVFGVGSDDAPEFRATGRDAKERGKRADEALELCRRLWSEERVTFRGEFYRYEDVTISPRPIQQPLPLWIGGSSPAAIRRTVRLGTGWLAGIQTPAQVKPVVAAIKAHGAEVGPADSRGPLRRELRVPARSRRRRGRVARLRRARARGRRGLRPEGLLRGRRGQGRARRASPSTATSASRSSC